MKTWKTASALSGMLLASALFPRESLGQEAASPSSAIPAGWYVYPESRLKKADEEMLHCFNISQNEWRVALAGDQLEIGKYAATPALTLEKPDFPPNLLHQPGMPGREVSSGLRSSIHIGDRWLLAYDAGEFGGGLWLTNDDGSEVHRITTDNVNAMARTRTGIVVVTGLAHLSQEYGNLYFLSVPDGWKLNLQYSVHLEGATFASTTDSDQSVLFATRYGLHRIRESGLIEDVAFFTPWAWRQYPTSIAALKDGSIYVGMRMFVLKLHPIENGYSQEWLLPETCRKVIFRPDSRNPRCECKP
jgi:hypothetical protein